MLESYRCLVHPVRPNFSVNLISNGCPPTKPGYLER
jgi:hypothetical protein